MKCEVFFIPPEKQEFKTVPQYLQDIPDSCRIITTSIGMYEFLESLGKNVKKFSDIVPEAGPKWNEVYQMSKSIHDKSKQAFQNLTFNDIQIFEGFEYKILMRLTVFMRVQKILEDNTDTIFIFDSRFTRSYYMILKIAKQLGYVINDKIGMINNNNIEYYEENSNKSEYKEKRSFLHRQKNILSSSHGNNLSFNKLKTYYRFTSRMLSFLVRTMFYKFLVTFKGESIQILLKKIDNKIMNINSNYFAACAFFVSAIREDLYLRPLYPIIEKFKKENIAHCLITSDISTGLVLSKTGIQFINFFDEFNFLVKEIKNSKKGKEVATEINQIISSNHSILGLNDFRDDIINYAYRSIAIIIICEHIIKKMNLKSIVVAPTSEIFEYVVIEIAKKYKIPSFSIIPGMADTNPFFINWFKTDKICVYGDHALEQLTKVGYDEKRICVTGNPKYDFLKNMDSKKSKLMLEQDLKIDSTKKLVVIGMSRWHEKDENWMSDLIKFCNINNFEIVIKIHPLYKTVSKYSENKIKTISDNCKDEKFFVIHDIEPPKLLSAADVMITDYSSMGLEAVFLGKPLISINLLKENWEEYTSRVEKYGASIYVENYKMLEKILLEILKENKHIDELKKGREKVIEKYNFGNDGKAAERIFNILMNPV